MTEYCAVIAAAKMGLRHNIMKPLLALNGSTVLKNTVETLRMSGCSPLIVVSGRNSADLIRHLGRKELLHVVNKDFGSTDMLHSLRLGLAEAPDDAELIFILPADVPLLNGGSLGAMLDYMRDHPTCELLRPTLRGQAGWPLLLRRKAAAFLREREHGGGLNDALAAYKGKSALLECADQGMLLFVDKQEDFERFLVYAAAQAQTHPLNCRADIILGREKPFFNSLLAELLRQIELTGSLATACAQVGISYSNGWKSLKSAEIQLGFELLDSSRGGSNGGVSRLTATARELLRRYERLERQIMQLCDDGPFDDFITTN